MNFPEDIISACPPADAGPASGNIYRMVKSFPPSPNDFDSDVSRNAPNHDRDNCNCWGCSVLVDEAAVESALGLFKFWRKRYIVACEVAPGDGVIKHTASNSQAAHHTFWKFLNAEVVSRCTIHRSPEGQQA